MLPPSLGVSSLTWAALRGAPFLARTEGEWFTMEGGLACTESADDRAFFSPVSTSRIVRRCFSCSLSPGFGRARRTRLPEADRSSPCPPSSWRGSIRAQLTSGRSPLGPHSRSHGYRLLVLRLTHPVYGRGWSTGQCRGSSD